MQTIHLSITGMSCGACRSHVTRALESVEGVEDVAVDLEQASATVAGQNFEPQMLINALEAEGYGGHLRS